MLHHEGVERQAKGSQHARTHARKEMAVWIPAEVSGDGANRYSLPSRWCSCYLQLAVGDAAGRSHGGVARLKEGAWQEMESESAYKDIQSHHLDYNSCNTDCQEARGITAGVTSR